jgi:hypothetical protein
VNGPLIVGRNSSVPLLVSRNPGFCRLVIVPPIVNVLSLQVMTILSTSRSVTIPVGFSTEHACNGSVGCTLTSTL